MASPAIGVKTCTLNVNLFSGARTAPPDTAKALLTIRNGTQENVSLPNNGFVSSASISVAGLPFFDNLGDNYAVVASADGYEQAGFFPVTVSPAAAAVVGIMLLGRNASFNFRNAMWKKLKQNYPAYAALLAAGASNDTEAGNRYSDLMEQRAPVLACYFNLVTAMSQIHLPVQTPLDYIKELIWDNTMAQDRFFAWADPAIIDQVIQATAQGEFAPEVGTALFHSGATRSWKQVQFGEANVQLTFHENNTKTIGGMQCVMIEPDIDYYKDLGAHALLEVIANKLTNSLTDPRQVYVLRWIAGRHAGVPDFEPPYTIE
jgi:hypothetical protein